MKQFLRYLALPVVIAAALSLSNPSSVQAQEYAYGDAPQSAPSQDRPSLSTNTVPLVSLGAGGFDMVDNAEQDKAADVRFEYRFGTPLFYVLKPMIGLEGTTDSGAGIFAGIIADWIFREHWVFSPSFAAGLWVDGGGKDMGHAIQFRSQLEAGYRFDNDWRLTVQASHISNADLGKNNPGSEIIGLYVHAPVEDIFPH